MQDMDFYSGKNSNPYSSYSAEKPEYSFAKSYSGLHDAPAHKRANRLFAVITALCIISFTVGLGMGIKFAGGNTDLIDPHTKAALVKNAKLGHLATPAEAAPQQSTSAKKLYPKSEYPFVIKIGADYTERQSKDIASYLSAKGNTVIISKHSRNFNIYTGPFKSKNDAEISLQKIKGYSDNHWYSNALILKR